MNQAINLIIQNDNELAELLITEEECIYYEGINNLLTPFEKATVRLSGSSYLTTQTVKPIYDKLITMFEFKEKDNTSDLVKKAATAGKNQFQKYYDKTTNYHDIETVLDPRLKLEFFKRKNLKESISAVFMKRFKIFYLKLIKSINEIFYRFK